MEMFENTTNEQKEVEKQFAEQSTTCFSAVVSHITTETSYYWLEFFLSFSAQENVRVVKKFWQVLFEWKSWKFSRLRKISSILKCSEPGTFKIIWVTI